MQVAKRFRNNAIKFCNEVLTDLKKTSFKKIIIKITVGGLSVGRWSVGGLSFGGLSFRCYCVGGLSVGGLSYNLREHLQIRCWNRTSQNLGPRN